MAKFFSSFPPLVANIREYWRTPSLAYVTHVRIWRYNWIVLTAIVAHAIFGISLLFSASPLYVTALASLNTWPPWQVGVLYLLASMLASIPLLRPHQYTPAQEFGFIALQQWLMMTTLWTIIIAVTFGQYPDGYTPTSKGNPHLFIFNDQLILILAILAHTCAVVDWIWFSQRRGVVRG